jgi:hypothetical protein
MEVHHHPDLHHSKKKHFKEYFLEFMMIFLAVTMGFIAENIREYLSDNSKEHEYISGLIKGFEDDSANLQTVLKANRRQMDGIDSLRKVSINKLAELPVQDSLYRLTTNYLFYADNFKNNDVTLSQLRNAGGYRLIHKEAVLDSISVYEARIHDLNDEFAGLYASLVKSREDANQVFDLNIGHQFKLHPTSTPVLITADKAKLYNYYNGCWLVLLSLQGYNYMMEDHLKYTTKLIAFIKKEYHVE